MTIEELLTILKKEENNHGPNHIEVAKVLNNLGNAYCCLADKLCNIQEAKYNLQKAKELLERALVIKERYHSSDHVEVAETLHSLGNCFLTLDAYYSLEDYQKAKELLEKALAIKERHYASNHVEVAETLHKLGNAYYYVAGELFNTQEANDNLKKAKELFERALVIKKRHYGSDHTEVAKLLNNLGSIAHALEDYQKAKELFESILPIFEKHYGSDHVKVARMALHNLGNAYDGLEDYQKAREFYERALAILERHYGSDRIEVANILCKLGNTYSNLEDYQKAKELYERALPIFEKHYGSDHVKVSEVTDQLASGIRNLSLKASTYTSLHAAARDGELEAVKYLMGEGYNINAVGNEDGRTPLHYAAWKGHLGVIKFLLMEGADIHVKDDDGSNSLHLAALSGHKDIVEFFLDQGLNINVSGELNFTPLHYAAHEGHLEITKFLVGRGANIYAKSVGGNKPIHIAAQRGHQHIVEFLLGQGLDINDHGKNNSTPLHLAAENGYLEVIKFLLRKGADIHAQNVDGNKALHVAALNGHKNIVEFLLEYGLDINDRDGSNSTLLHLAAKKGDLTITKFLLKKGVSINIPGELNFTPLHCAAYEGQLEITKFLLEKGANIYAKSIGGSKPIHIAAQRGHQHIVEFLLEQGVGINDSGKNNSTLLHFAADNGHLEVAKFLIDKGANVNAKTTNSERPIDLAKKSNHSSIVELLSPYQYSYTQQNTESGCIIQSAYSHKKQQKAFSRLSKLINHNTDIRQVEQGLYLSAFKKRKVKINGKCSAITCAFSQILFLGLDLNQSDLHKLFLHNLKTSAEIYERIAQGKQISLREEREIFALSKLLDNFEQQLDSPTSSLPSRFSHVNSYKQLDDLSSYISSLADNFAIHLVTDNHVVAIYRTGNTYSYFDSNVTLITGLKNVDQLIKVVEKGISSVGYKLAKQGLLVEHFNVTKANKSLSIEQKQVLAKLIQTERNLLSLQDRELGPINLSGKQVPRTILYDIGVKLYLDGASILINADIDSRNLAQNLHEGKIKIAANEYLQTLKNSSDQTAREAVQVARVVPFEGSCNEIKHAQQITNSIEKSQNDQKEKLPKFLAVLLGKLNKEPTDLLSDNPATCLNDVLVNNKFEYRSAHRM